MKNRRLPFGYRMEMGELTLHTQEAEVVRWIFGQYGEGVAYSSLVAKLNGQPIPYDEGKPWNKNMVARMLEDRRYIGEKGYPAIISAEAFDAAWMIRDTRKTTAKSTESEKLLRQLSGQRRTKMVEAQTLAILNTIIDDPSQIQCPPSARNGDTCLTAELDAFQSPNQGLLLAEVEFSSEEQALSFTPPDWFGEDVTRDYHYQNSYMSRMAISR